MTNVRQGQLPRWWRANKRRRNAILCLHTTEGAPPTAAQANLYDARRAEQVSTQWFVDAAEIVREVAQADVAFTMAPWNDCTSNVEICGRAVWTDWDPRITDNVTWLMAHEWQGPLVVLTPAVIIAELEAGRPLPEGVSCHRWLNDVTEHFGASWLAPVTGYTGSGNVDTSHTDPGPTLIGRIPELVRTAQLLRGGARPTDPPMTGGKKVLTKINVEGHWAKFYGDADEQGIILEVFHAGPRLNTVYDDRKAQEIMRTRDSMRDFAPSAEMLARFPIPDAPGIPAWTAADFYQGD